MCSLDSKFTNEQACLWVKLLFMLVTCPYCRADLSQHLEANTAPVPTTGGTLLPGTICWHYQAREELAQIKPPQIKSSDSTMTKPSRLRLNKKAISSKFLSKSLSYCRRSPHLTSLISPPWKIQLDSWCSLLYNFLLLHGCWILTWSCKTKHNC